MVWRLPGQLSRIAVWPRNSSSGCIPRRSKIRDSKKYLCTRIYSSIILNRQKVRMTQVSTDGWLGKQSVVLGEVYTYHTEQPSPHPFPKVFISPSVCVCVCVCVCLVTQLCLILCNPMDCSPPGSPVHGILQARILEWVAISFPRDHPDPGIEPMFLSTPTLAGGFLTTVPPRKSPNSNPIPRKTIILQSPLS